MTPKEREEIEVIGIIAGQAANILRSQNGIVIAYEELRNIQRRCDELLKRERTSKYAGHA